MREKLQEASVASRPISRGTRWVLVALRIYVFAMMALFVYKFFLVIHAR